MVTTDTYVLSNSILNCICPGILIVIELYFHVKFSGVPFRSGIARQRLIRMNIIMIIWGVSRGVAAGLGLSNIDNQKQIFIAILGNKSPDTLVGILLGPCIFVLESLMLEVVPIMLVADGKTIENFYIKSEIYPHAKSSCENSNGTNEPLILYEQVDYENVDRELNDDSKYNQRMIYSFLHLNLQDKVKISMESYNYKRVLGKDDVRISEQIVINTTCTITHII